jgi:heme A synthase
MATDTRPQARGGEAADSGEGPPQDRAPAGRGAGTAPLRRFAWGVLAYNLLVIAWGAFVRATGSGAGCGSHWPLCNGEVIPRPERIETMIEFGHRLSSGVDGLLVLALAVWAFRLFPRRHPVRPAAAWSLVFLVVEALIGAGLVRFELVADDASLARALVMAAHLINTFLLLAALTLTAHRAGKGEAAPPARLSARATLALAAGFLALIVVSTTGAIAALGDTLFPADTFRQGLAQDLSPTAHLLVRLRVLHPILAAAAALLVPAAAGWLARRSRAPALAARARAVTALIAVQIAAGFLNLALAAPVWMQLVHLVLADLVWIAWVLLGADAAAAERPALADDARPAPEPARA